MTGLKDEQGPASAANLADYGNRVRALMAAQQRTPQFVAADSRAAKITAHDVDDVCNGRPVAETVVDVVLKSCGLRGTDLADCLARYRKLNAAVGAQTSSHAALAATAVTATAHIPGSGHSDPAHAAEAVSASPPAAESAKSRWKKFTESPLQQFIAVVLAVITLAATITTVLQNGDDGGESPDKGATVTITGSGARCINTGNIGVFVCDGGAGPSLVNVEASHESVSYVYFKGPASKLAQVKPPRYTSTNEPCNDWWEWLRARPDIYFPDLAQQIVLTANTGEQAIATGMTVSPTAAREPAGDGVWIKCGFGGGSNPAFHIEYSTLTRKARVQTDDAGELGPWQEMPPGTAGPEGDIKLADVSLHVVGVPGMLYQGVATVALKLNGKPDTAGFGSHAQPLRWIAGAASIVPDESQMWFYDQDAGQWKQGFSPLAGEGDEGT